MLAMRTERDTTGEITLQEPQDTIVIYGWAETIDDLVFVQQCYSPRRLGPFKLLDTPRFCTDDTVLPDDETGPYLDSLREGFMLHKEAAAAYQDWE